MEVADLAWRRAVRAEEGMRVGGARLRKAATEGRALRECEGVEEEGGLGWGREVVLALGFREGRGRSRDGRVSFVVAR